MKKLSKKVVALLMSICLGANLYPAVSVVAATSDDFSTIAEIQIEPRFSYIMNASAHFLSSGNFSVNLSGTSDVKSVKFTIELEKKVLIWYSTGKSFTKTFVGSSGSYADSFDLDSSGTYRIKVTYEVFTANDSETVVKYAEA